MTRGANQLHALVNVFAPPELDLMQERRLSWARRGVHGSSLSEPPASESASLCGSPASDACQPLWWVGWAPSSRACTSRICLARRRLSSISVAALMLPGKWIYLPRPQGPSVRGLRV